MSAAMVERVAEALWQAESVRALGRPRLVPWAQAGDDAHKTCRHQAAAAIKAMREPTRKMIDAEQMWGPTTYEEPGCIWRSIIDAALTP